MRENVDAVSRFDGFIRKLQKRSARDDACIVNENVDFPDLLLHGFGDFVDLFLVGYVNNVAGAFEAFSFKSFCGRFDGCKRLNFD